jgi:hypothetical protein
MGPFFVVVESFTFPCRLFYMKSYEDYVYLINFICLAFSFVASSVGKRKFCTEKLINFERGRLLEKNLSQLPAQVATDYWRHRNR